MHTNTNKGRSMRDSWRPRENKETGETAETNGCKHKHKQGKKYKRELETEGE